MKNKATHAFTTDNYELVENINKEIQQKEIYKLKGKNKVKDATSSRILQMSPVDIENLKQSTYNQGAFYESLDSDNSNTSNGIESDKTSSSDKIYKLKRKADCSANETNIPSNKKKNQ